MDEASANALRAYVSNGGAVLMTAFSAKVDEHGQWFDTPLPGRLHDVFGLRTSAFYDVPTPLEFDLDGHTVNTGVRRYEVLEPSTAEVVSRFTNTAGNTPAITINHFGKGAAMYLATESKTSSIGPVLNHLYAMTGVQRGPQTPEGVFARIVDGRTLYVNTTEQQERVVIDGTKRGILTNRVYANAVVLDPLEADLVP
jgi:beta-galactosidase